MRPMRNILLSIILLTSLSVDAKVALPSLIADNMMLQQQTEVRLWGSAKEGAEVTITASWSDNTVWNCRADRDGRWSVMITTPAASFTSYDISFSDGEGAVGVSNVLIGEVWLAAGQSNMQMPLRGFAGCCVQDGLDDAIAAKQYEGVRMFNVPMRQSYTPQEECGGRWMTTENFRDVMDFSATAFYFATNLSQALGIPVGIVNCSYGGTRVESWLPKEILEGYADISADSAEISTLKPEYERPMVTGVVSTTR